VTLAKFVTECKLATLDEVSKACHLAYYHLKKEGVAEFAASDCAKWIDAQNLSKPNVSRLTEKLKKSRETVNGSKPGTFRLHHNYLQQMDAQYPSLSEKSQEVTDDGTILPPSLYQNTRGYIESVAKQINRSYEENIFDGCAVLMRRLEEILLIMAYEHLGIAAEIKGADGNYVLLEAIVKNAEGNAKLNLGRNSRKSIDVFRERGNYSAHKIYYLCKREYIREKIDEYIDELLHKAALKT
jgi:hypothetical protein